MIEIIPNWHPIFVHFAIGLLTISTGFHLVVLFNRKSTNYHQFESVANWNLWIGSILAVVTVVAGWLAYNSVDHDTPSHLAMTDHRNWAMGTAGVFVALAIWSFQRARKSIPIGWVLVTLLVIATGLLGATGFKGGELVFRHGLGVMSLPKSEEGQDGHDHDHGGGHGDSIDRGMSGNVSGSAEAEHDGGETAHSHDQNDNHSQSHDSLMESAQEKSSEDSHADGHDHGDHPH